VFGTDNMDKLHKESADSMDLGYAWFDVPRTNTSTIGFNKQTVVPSAFSGGQIDFTIKVPNDSVIDLSETYLKYAIKATKADGSVIGDDPKVWLSDCAGHAAFQTISVKINGQQVEYESNYPSKASLWNLMYLTSEEKKQNGRLYGWIEDRYTGTDGLVSDARKALSKSDAEFYVKLNLSLFNLNRYIAPGTEISLQLTQADPTLVLNAANNTPDGGGKFSIIDPELHVTRLVPNSSLLDACNAVLMTNKPLIFPAKKGRLNTYNLAEGSKRATFRLLLYRVPQSLVIAFTESKRLVGEFASEQAIFKPQDISKIELRVDGLDKVLSYETDQELKKGFLEPYQQLKKMCTNDIGSFGISFEEFVSKYCIFPFSLLDNSGTGLDLSRKGDITCTVTFKTAPTVALSMIVIAHSDALITIEKEGKVITVGESL
jgi:hypothetical protein